MSSPSRTQTSTQRLFEGTTPSPCRDKEREIFIPLPRKVVVKSEGAFPSELKEKFVKICKTMDPKSTGQLNHSDVYKALALSVSQYNKPLPKETKIFLNSSDGFISQKTINDIMKRYPTDGGVINYKDLMKTVEHSFEEAYKPYDPALKKGVAPPSPNSTLREFDPKSASTLETKLQKAPSYGTEKHPRLYVNDNVTLEQGSSIVDTNGNIALANVGEPNQKEASDLPNDLSYIRRSLLESTTPNRLFTSLYNYDLDRKGKLDEASFLHVLSSHGIYVDKSMAKKIASVAGEDPSDLGSPTTSPPKATPPASPPKADENGSKSRIIHLNQSAPLAIPPQATVPPPLTTTTTNSAPVANDQGPLDKPALTPDPQRYHENLPIDLGSYIYGPQDPYRRKRTGGFYTSLKDPNQDVNKTRELPKAKDGSGTGKVINYERFFSALQLPAREVEVVENTEKARTRTFEGEEPKDVPRDGYLPIGESNWKVNPLNLHPIQRGRGFAPLYNTYNTVQVDGSTYSTEGGEGPNDVKNGSPDPEIAYSTPSNVPSEAKYSLCSRNYQKKHNFVYDPQGHSVRTAHRNASLDVIAHTDAAYDHEEYDERSKAISSHGHSGKKQYSKASVPPIGGNPPQSPVSPSRRRQYPHEPTLVNIIKSDLSEIPPAAPAPPVPVEPKEKAPQDEIKSGSPSRVAPHSGKKTNWPASAKNYIRIRETINWGDASSSATFDNTELIQDPVQDRLKSQGRIDGDGNNFTQRKNYGWANASRPMHLLVGGGYDPDPERPTSPGEKGKTVNVVIKPTELSTLTSSPPQPNSILTTDRPISAPGVVKRELDVDEFYERANKHVYSALGAHEPPIPVQGGRKTYGSDNPHMKDNLTDIVKGGVPVNLYNTFDPQFEPRHFQHK